MDWTLTGPVASPRSQILLKLHNDVRRTIYLESNISFYFVPHSNIHTRSLKNKMELSGATDSEQWSASDVGLGSQTNCFRGIKRFNMLLDVLDSATNATSLHAQLNWLHQKSIMQG